MQFTSHINNYLRTIQSSGDGKHIVTKRCVSKVPTPPKGQRQSWEDIEVQKEFFDRISKELAITSPEDWYQRHTRDVTKYSYTFLKRYDHSLLKVLETFHPSYKWKFWLFPKSPKKWNDVNCQREYIEWLGETLGVKDKSDWYKVSIQQVVDNHGARLLSLKGNMYNILQSVYPDYPWEEEKFNMRNKYTSKAQNNIFDKIFRKMNMKSLDDWYDVNVAEHPDLKTLLSSKYGNSIIKALQNVYPEHNWTIFKFKRVPKGFWNDMKNQRIFFDTVGKEELNINTMNDWLHADIAQSQRILNFITKHYGSSLFRALKAIYPEHRWEFWKFKRSPAIGPLTQQEKIEVAEFISKKLRITTMDDWYRISLQQIDNVIGKQSFLEGFGGIHKFLSDCYPDIRWDISRLKASNKKSSQRLLYVFIKELFPGHDIRENYLSSHLRFSTNEPIEIDVYIPKLLIGFEYQGKHHYSNVNFFGPSSMYKSRDQEKRKICERNNVRLIDIPYWWDDSIDSLHSTIYKYAPHLLPNPGNTPPIPDLPPTREKLSM